MRSQTTLFILPVLNIEINESLGEGIEIGNKLYLTWKKR